MRLFPTGPIDPIFDNPLMNVFKSAFSYTVPVLNCVTLDARDLTGWLLPYKCSDELRCASQIGHP